LKKNICLDSNLKHQYNVLHFELGPKSTLLEYNVKSN